MKNFIKNNGHWLRIAVILAGIIYAAGKITSTQAALTRQVAAKVSKEVYETDRIHWDKRFDNFQDQLKRIEGKLDAVLVETSP